ncbi:hypothetical protein BKA82DRAFT_81191, partial [Pisolithus tinctorius]
MLGFILAKDDTVLTFSYDGEADPDTFSLNQLWVLVNSHFGKACNLKKLVEGSYHKVYDVHQEDGTSLGVVHVAAPAFLKDKLKSEVVTFKYLASQTQIPISQVYTWNLDASNPVGAEYMFMQTVPGISANAKWDTLLMSVKEHVVSQVAEYLKVMFVLCFNHTGALYLSPEDDVHVGPIIGIPFYHAADGIIC